MTTHTDAPADDLVARLTARRTQKRWVLTGRGGYVQRDNPDRLCSEAAARIRSLEAQRDEAVGLLRRSNEALANVTAFEWDAREIMGNTNFEICKHAREQVRAFLDSLTEKR